VNYILGSKYLSPVIKSVITNCVGVFKSQVYALDPNSFLLMCQ
jgi:hypothetical protein